MKHKGNGFKSDRGNHQIPSTNNQIMTEVPMTKFSRKLAGFLVIRRLDNWNLINNVMDRAQDENPT
jgi:hypothetical protein